MASLGNQKYKIVGTVKFGAQEVESGIIFMGLKSAQSLLAMGNRVNVIAIKADNLDNVNKIKNELV